MNQTLADGYYPPTSPLISTTGVASLLTAPFGCHGINLAAISAATWCGMFYCIVGLFGWPLAALFSAFPKELVLSIAALALFGSIISGLTVAMAEPKQRESALITLVTASGMTLFSIGSALWGIIAGVVTLLILNARKAD
ncbi:Benzoate transporter [Pseudomonas syringae pv. cilantro]|nr:Benzoate transporter [Pseudomonas syringae pv. cilantro]